MQAITPKSPFTGNEQHELADRQLVTRILAGNREALEDLIARHRPWIYNLAFRMVMVHEDAEDATQEVLIKVLTKLEDYNPEKGAFRTWLYRIVTNHVINMKKRGYEPSIKGFEEYYSFVEQIPDQDPDASPETHVGTGGDEGRGFLAAPAGSLGPFYDPSAATAWLKDLLERREFKDIWDLQEPERPT